MATEAPPQLPNRRRRLSGRPQNPGKPKEIELKVETSYRGVIKPDLAPMADKALEKPSRPNTEPSTSLNPNAFSRTKPSSTEAPIPTQSSPSVSADSYSPATKSEPSMSGDEPDYSDLLDNERSVPDSQDYSEKPEEESSQPVDDETKSLYDANDQTYDEPGNLPDENEDSETSKNGSSFNPFRRNKDTVDRDDISDKENSADEAEDDGASDDENSKVGRGYRASQADDEPGRLAKLAGFVKGRRKKIFFGTALGGGIVGVVMSFTLVSGPLEFLHIAQLLQKAHFSHQQNAGDDRMGRLYRYIKSGHDIGETRLSWLESRYKDRILTQLADIGLEPVYDKTTKYLKSANIDTTNEKSPYHGMSEEEVKAAVAEKYGSKATLTANAELGNGRYNVEVSGVRGATKLNAGLAKETGNSIIPTVIRQRIMAKYGMATWHPLKLLDKKASQKLADVYSKWREDRQGRLKGKVGNNTVSTTGGQDSSDEGQKPTSIANSTDEVSSSKVKDTFSAIKTSKTLKVTGGVAAVAGIVCAAKTVNDNIGAIKFAQVIAPLMRMALDVVATAAQIMSGQQVDPNNLSFLSKSFNGKDSADPSAPASSWAQAKTMQIDANQTPSGTDIDQETKQLITQGRPDWLSWTESEPVKQLCGTAGSIITGVFSTTLGVLTGGVISTVVGATAGALAGPTILSKLSHLIAGDAIDVLAAGAQWGNYINYGARLAANSMSLIFGGVALSSSASSALTLQENEFDQADFNSHGIAYRLFSTDDQRSAISKLIDNSAGSTSQNFAKLGNYFLNFGNLFNPISKLAFGFSSANAASTYDYGFPEYGFSLEDLNSDVAENPYANAEDVAKLLDNNAVVSNGTSYQEQAAKCFGVNIAKTQNEDGTQTWDVLPVDRSELLPNPLDTEKYNPDDCARSGDANWLKLRFFILDTGVMEGWACFEGDSQSCQNDGMDVTSSSGSFSNQYSQPSNRNIYILGDSLTEGMQIKGSLRAKLQEKGWNNIIVSATCGRALAEGSYQTCDSGNPTANQGLSQVEQTADRSAIAQSGTVVVALGTNNPNQSEADFTKNVQAMISNIKAINPTTKIYWVNAYDDSDNNTYSGVNSALASLASQQKFSLIDWAAEAKNNKTKYAPFIGDTGRPQVHPSDHYNEVADFEISQIGSSQ